MKEWPRVDEHDDGIRPAGPPDACFYCQRRVGELHAADCVTIQKRIEMEVTIRWSDDSETTGLWQFDDPYDWTEEMSEFHKNDSSWCANNIVRDLGATTFDAKTRKRLEEFTELGITDERAAASNQSASTSCLCDLLSFKFVRVVDDTPRRETKRPS